MIDQNQFVPVPNFLRVEVMTYRKKAPSEEICWRLMELTTSEDRARHLLDSTNSNLRVVECLPDRRLVVDRNYR